MQARREKEMLVAYLTPKARERVQLEGIDSLVAKAKRNKLPAIIRSNLYTARNRKLEEERPIRQKSPLSEHYKKNISVDTKKSYLLDEVEKGKKSGVVFKKVLTNQSVSLVKAE